jgi:hypothetical protein
MNKLQQKLREMGIADTRLYYVEDALAQCHRAFSPLDTHNRKLVIKNIPFLAQCARFYGLNSVASNTFEGDGIEMPEDIDARVREIMDNL